MRAVGVGCLVRPDTDFTRIRTALADRHQPSFWGSKAKLEAGYKLAAYRMCGPGEVDVILRYLSPRLYLRLTLRRAPLHAISPRFLHAATGNLERVPRIELGSTGWKPGTLPICHARIAWCRLMESNHISRGKGFTVPRASQRTFSRKNW